MNSIITNNNTSSSREMMKNEKHCWDKPISNSGRRCSIGSLSVITTKVFVLMVFASPRSSSHVNGFIIDPNPTASTMYLTKNINSSIIHNKIYKNSNNISSKLRRSTTPSPTVITKRNTSSSYPLLSKGTSATIPLLPRSSTVSSSSSSLLPALLSFNHGCSEFSQKLTNALSSSLPTFGSSKSSSRKSHSTSTIAVPIVLGSILPFGIGGCSVANSMMDQQQQHHHLIDYSSSTSKMAIDPIVEGEIFSGLAHVALDLLTLFFAPATIVLRLAGLVGRMFAMAADYVPDHDILPEELLFQLFMLCIAWIGLVKSLTPLAFSILASPTTITIRDGKAYSVLFQPSGLTWNQYKALTVCALEWVTVQPGSIITSDEEDDIGTANETTAKDSSEYIYWLYNGSVEVQSKGKTVQVVTAQYKDVASFRKNAGRALLGEGRLLSHMSTATTASAASRSASTASKIKNILYNNSSSKKKNTMKTAYAFVNNEGVVKNNDDTSDTKSTSMPSSYPRTTIMASSSGDSAGATLLRIHIPNLKMLMDTDPQFADSIRTMLLHGMQSKLHAQFEQKEESSAIYIQTENV